MNLALFFIRLLATTGNGLHSKDLKWINNKNSVVLIDMENVRGKAFFQISHREILKRTTLWTKLYNLEDRVSIIVDHGSEQSAYYLPEGGISMVFSGPSIKADDILARDVSFFDRNVCVVTGDNNLMSRCKSSMDRSSKFKIEFLKPKQFLKNLQQLNERIDREKSKVAKEASTETIYSKRMEVKSTRMLCKQLGSKESGPDDNLSILQTAISYDRKFEDENIIQWEKERDRTRTRRNEKTKDRVFLAEHFRQKIKDEIEPRFLSTREGGVQEKYPYRYVKYINDLVRDL